MKLLTELRCFDGGSWLKNKQMKTFEQDQESVRGWSSFLDIESFFSYGASDTQDSGSIYDRQYVDDYHYDLNCNYVQNDEFNQAHTIQGLSQLAVEQIAESSHTEEEQRSKTYITSDWPPPSYTSYWHENEGHGEEVDCNESSTSCSSPEDISYKGEENYYSLEVMDDSSLDGELGKRLTQMVPVPHVPKINGEIPSVDKATSDHQRLLDRLQLYDLVERKIQGDGNCQFRALSDQFYRSLEHHEFVRQQVVTQLKSHPEDYEGYVPMEYSEYLKKMSNNGEWGDHVTLQAAADYYGLKIFVITSFKDTCYIEILPKIQKSSRVIFLSFWAEVHYNSIYPRGDPPSDEVNKRKKKWWRFGHKH